MKNPALTLYNYWLTVLNGARLRRDNDGWLQGALQFGRDPYMGLHPLPRHGIGTPKRPTIAYGYSHHGTDAKFAIDRYGNFRMVNMHGYKVRNAIERNTFLTWHHGFGGYNWTAHDTNTVERNHGYRPNWLLTEWDQPFQYVPEWAMRLQWYDGDWMHLEEVDGQWHIQPKPSMSLYPELDDRPELFARAESLRQKRYQRAERAWLRSTGQLPPLGKSLTTEEREWRAEQNREKALHVILTHFDVSTPARSTPLRREREEGLWPLQPGRR